MPLSEVEKIFQAFAEERKRALPQFTPDGIPITLENKFDDAIYNYLYAYWKEQSGEYDPKKDVIPESEMNKMHPKTKNEFQFEKWLFEQYGMTKKEERGYTVKGNLESLWEIFSAADMVLFARGLPSIGKELAQLGKKAVDDVAEEAIEKTVKKEAAEEMAESTAKKDMADTTEDLSKETVKKENALEDSSRVKGGSGAKFDINKLTRSQKKAIESAENTINDHLKESDLSAALNDLQGNPIEKPGGGYWNHAQEVRDAYPSLKRAKNTLEGSLKNPNLEPDVRNYIQSKYDTITEYMTRIEDLFAPYGGI